MAWGESLAALNPAFLFDELRSALFRLISYVEYISSTGFAEALAMDDHREPISPIGRDLGGMN